MSATRMPSRARPSRARHQSIARACPRGHGQNAVRAACSRDSREDQGARWRLSIPRSPAESVSKPFATSVTTAS
jgi:hypothetical protein